MSNKYNDLLFEAHVEECENLTGQQCGHTPEQIFAMYEELEPTEELL